MLKAGTAVEDISPAEPLHLGGYPHVERTSTGIHDPLLASSLFLDNGTVKLMIAALDILFVDRATARRLRKIISRELSVAEEHVFISCTHTHSGPLTVTSAAGKGDSATPEVDTNYVMKLEEGVVSSAFQAAANTRPAEIAWTSADVEGVGCNRHDSEGPRDPEACILVVRDSEKKTPLALSVTYSMHPTVLHEDSKLVSSDFPHYTRLQIAEDMGGAPTVLYHTGPSGNQSPRYHVRAQTFEEAERLGRLLGRSVSERARELADGDFESDVVLGGAMHTIALSRREFPPLEEAEKNLERCRKTYERLEKENSGHGPVRTAECAVFGAEEMVTLARLQESGDLEEWFESYERAEVQVARIGSACMAGFPCEIFVEYGLELKRRASSKAFAVSLVNGESQGYIVTEESAEGGGYEADFALFAPESGNIMIEAALGLISRMNEK